MRGGGSDDVEDCAVVGGCHMHMLREQSTNGKGRVCLSGVAGMASWRTKAGCGREDGVRYDDARRRRKFGVAPQKARGQLPLVRA
ncbi:hypothetical protein HYQ46_012821 [Verticillium longisporum]|nr:hypothetical protein HYQ46_012821 [Verticillium longisporum]